MMEPTQTLTSGGCSGLMRKSPPLDVGDSSYDMVALILGPTVEASGNGRADDGPGNKEQNEKHENALGDGMNVSATAIRSRVKFAAIFRRSHSSSVEPIRSRVIPPLNGNRRRRLREVF
jgi:hypothetical protein